MENQYIAMQWFGSVPLLLMAMIVFKVFNEMKYFFVVNVKVVIFVLLTELRSQDKEKSGQTGGGPVLSRPLLCQPPSSRPASRWIYNIHHQARSQISEHLQVFMDKEKSWIQMFLLVKGLRSTGAKCLFICWCNSSLLEGWRGGHPVSNLTGKLRRNNWTYQRHTHMGESKWFSLRGTKY